MEILIPGEVGLTKIIRILFTNIHSLLNVIQDSLSLLCRYYVNLKSLHCCWLIETHSISGVRSKIVMLTNPSVSITKIIRILFTNIHSLLKVVQDSLSLLCRYYVNLKSLHCCWLFETHSISVVKSKIVKPTEGLVSNESWTIFRRL